MRDIVLNESIHLDKDNGVHLLTFCSDKPSVQTFVLELFNCEVFEYSKYCDGDLLTIHLSPEVMNKLCSAYLNYKNNNKTMPS